MKNINRQTHIFIFELVIAIAFFALASSICVQFFVKAHSLSKETGYVEEFLNDPTIYQVNQKYIHYYDKNWKDCHKKNSTYSIKIYCSDKDSIETIHVTVYHYHKKIYSITSDQYIKEDNHES